MSDQVLLCSLDFQKAFDKVPYLRLLRKLSSHCMDHLKLLMKSAGVKSYFAQWRAVTNGIPPELVLEPVPSPVLSDILINNPDKRQAVR